MSNDISSDRSGPAERPWPSSTSAGFVADSLAAAAVYFVLVQVVVSALGPLREFFVRAGSDPLFATLAEATVVAFVMTYGSGWSTRTFGVPARAPARLIVGFGAMGLLCAFPGLRLMFAGATLSDLRSLAASGPGVITVLTLVLGVVLPLARARR